jgi:hypothetical protein
MWGGGEPPKFPTKLSNFRQTPPFALEKAVFSPLLGQNFRKFVIFREGTLFENCMALPQQINCLPLTELFLIHFHSSLSA